MSNEDEVTDFSAGPSCGSELRAEEIRFSASRAKLELSSIPNQSRFNRSATTPVVPEPMKESRTNPGCHPTEHEHRATSWRVDTSRFQGAWQLTQTRSGQPALMRRSTRASGKTAKCAPRKPAVARAITSQGFLPSGCPGNPAAFRRSNPSLAPAKGPAQVGRLVRPFSTFLAGLDRADR